MSAHSLSRGAAGLCGGVCLLASVTNAPATAEEGDNAPFTNLLFAYTSVPTPSVTEDTKDSAGVNTAYDWKGGSSRGEQGSVSVIHGVMHPNGGFVWGGGLALAVYNTTPDSYEVAGANFANGSGARLAYESLGVDIVAGYQYGVATSDEFHGYIEILPLFGAGVSRASSEVRSGGVYTKSDGNGYYYQYGLRVGAYVTDRHWIFGVMGSYLGGSGTVDIDFPGGFTSTVRFETSGLGFGTALGYRF